MAPPHGGRLVNLLADRLKGQQLLRSVRGAPSWALTPRQLCDLELLTTGGFSPLSGFLGRADYESVLAENRLKSGLIWPIPVCLDVPAELGERLRGGGELLLQGAEGEVLAVLNAREAWKPDRSAEAKAVYGTLNAEHPGVNYLLHETHPWYVGGEVVALGAPRHEDFPELRLRPAALREEFAREGWTQIVAFQTRNPLHRAHQELTLRAAREARAHLLVHPVVGQTKPGDVDHVTRVLCYRAVMGTYPAGFARLALLPLAMRMAGPREAVWHAIIRKNHGATHFIVGRDHAGPGKDSQGNWFYDPYAAQEMLRSCEAELGIRMVEFRAMVYVEDLKKYVAEDEVPGGTRTLSISGTELRRRLGAGEEIPEWFTFPEVVRILRERPLSSAG